MKLGKHEGVNKDFKRPRLCTIFCFALMHALCMKYVTETFLLVSSSVSNKQLL